MESNVGTTPPQTDAGASSADTMNSNTPPSQNMVERAQAQAASKIKDAKNEAAQTLSSLASTLHQSGSQLRSDQQQLAGDYLNRAADGIEKVASYLQKTDAREVADSIETFARRRPELFIGSAFAVGLIAARFLKSSGRRTPLLTAEAGPSAGMTDREVPTSISYERPGTAPVADTVVRPEP